MLHKSRQEKGESLRFDSTTVQWLKRNQSLLPHGAASSGPSLTERTHRTGDENMEPVCSIHRVAVQVAGTRATKASQGQDLFCASYTCLPSSCPPPSGSSLPDSCEGWSWTRTTQGLCGACSAGRSAGIFVGLQRSVGDRGGHSHVVTVP